GMRRREFITLVGGAVFACPFFVRSYERIRRVGVLMAFPEDDPEAKGWLAAFREGLERRGWFEGRNLRIEALFAAARGDRIPALAKELVSQQPDVILTQSTVATRAVQRESRTVLIVFA